jgi:PEP-CTERM motif
MSDSRSTASIWCAVVLGAYLGIAPDLQGGTVTFRSNKQWSVLSSSNVPVGNAEYVALNASMPIVQPTGAVQYGVFGSGWSADLSTIPGAYWIWAPGVTGDTPNASLAEYAFYQKFDLAGTPISGSISVAVDDMAQVYVNGMLAGTTGSITNIAAAFQAQSELKSFDLTPFLVSGTNTIEVLAQNGPDSFGGVIDADYRQNTAGVVFGGTLSFQSVPEPSSAALLGLGGLALLLFTGKRGKLSG